MRFLVGFAIGLLFGAAVTLLITPQSGQDLQQSAKNRLDDVLAEGRRAATARRAELENRLADLKSGL